MENVLTLIEEHLDGFRGDACLVRDQKGNYFVVSTVEDQFSHACSSSLETMAFRADEDGNITDWVEVAGGADMSRVDVFETLTRGDRYLIDEPPIDETIFDSEWYPDEDWEDWHREDETLSEYEHF